MRRPTRHPTLDRLHQHTQTKRTTKRTAKRTAHQPPTLNEPQVKESTTHYPQGHFHPRHDLTPAQAWEAQQLLNRANRLRPLHGLPDAQRRAALRKAGIIAAVKQGRVGNSAFGRQLHGHRGGKARTRWGLRHLRAMAPLGSQAAAAKRHGQQAQQDAEDALPRWEEGAGTLPWTGETSVYWPEEWSV